jgi:hypothetical protein
VNSIGSYAFAGCQELTTIEIPKNVSFIGIGAFESCSSMRQIVIPETVYTIQYFIFKDCEPFTIYCEAESQPNYWDKDWNAAKFPVVWGYTAE